MSYPRQNGAPRPVNNTIYEALGERWYDADDDPVALLRAESRLRNPWVSAVIKERAARFEGPPRVLDVGCGAGFLSNHLAREGCAVTGLDASPESLAVASRRDTSGQAIYRHGDALSLPFEDGAFDVVCAMDFLEHVEEPARVVAEASRVLRPGGVFFFHTFNRNWLSWLVVIKGVEWVVKNTPPDMHVLRLFVTPKELRAMCEANRLMVVDLRGSSPVFASRGFFDLLRTGVVPPDFRFAFTRSTLLSYTGFAEVGFDGSGKVATQGGAGGGNAPPFHHEMMNR